VCAEARIFIDTDNIRCRWQDDLDGVCRFDCFDPVVDLSDACARVPRDPRLLAIVSSLYGEPACLFKDKLIFKAPHTLGYKLHQDYVGWESFPKTFLTAIVAIDRADAENGATEVFPGDHSKGCLSPADGKYHQLADDAVDSGAGVVLELAPGDVALFSGYTPHRSRIPHDDNSLHEIRLEGSINVLPETPRGLYRHSDRNVIRERLRRRRCCSDARAARGRSEAGASAESRYASSDLPGTDEAGDRRLRHRLSAGHRHRDQRARLAGLVERCGPRIVSAAGA
jgi:hypothetical protein